jgi:hypothetical protein
VGGKGTFLLNLDTRERRKADTQRAQICEHCGLATRGATTAGCQFSELERCSARIPRDELIAWQPTVRGGREKSEPRLRLLLDQLYGQA